MIIVEQTVNRLEFFLVADLVSKYLRWRDSGNGYASKSCNRLNLGLSGWWHCIHISSITKRLPSELKFHNVDK